MSSFFELPDIYQMPWYNWCLALFAVSLVGFSKAGLKGIAILTVTIMALVFGGKASTGVLVPMLIVADVLAVLYYHRHAQWHYLRRLLPWMIGGIVLGAMVGKDLPEDIFKQSMAVIILFSVVMMYWWERRQEVYIPDNWWFGGIMGLLAGFCTMIGNLAGAFSNIFFLAMRLPKNHFIGSAAWLFLITNSVKIPFHIFWWETVTMETVALNIRLLPGLILGFVIGVRLIKLIKDKQYRKLVLALTAIGAIVIWVR